jgi:FtsZ-binding cell division protein ZapB
MSVEESHTKDDGKNLIFSQDFLKTTIENSHAKLRTELKADLLLELTKHIEETVDLKLKSALDDVATLKMEVNDLKKTASDAYDIANDNAKKVETLEQKVKELSESKDEQNRVNEDIVQQLKGCKEDNNKLEDQLDDQTNRLMRANIVLRGVPETETENELTIDVASRFLFEHIYKNTDGGITLHGVRLSIVRAHRSKFDPSREHKGPRPIFLKFLRDDYATNVLDLSIRMGVFKATGVRVNQQFCKRVQVRRDEAMKLRRTLLRDKEIEKGHVDYPAKLFVKYHGNPKYTLLKEF